MTPQFTHLHVHSHYSILDGMSKVPDLISKCKRCGMYSIALTDHGNMYGIKELMDCVKKENGKVKDKIKAQQAILANDGATPQEKQEAEYQISQLQQTFFKPIAGIETYCAHTSRTLRDNGGWHLILLAKNKKGYQNLCKLSSIAFTEGFYKHARIDHQLLEQYHEGIIVSSACLGGEVPRYIQEGRLEEAEQSILWFKNLFGDDYYLELQRHKSDKPNAPKDVYERQVQVNEVLVQMARKHNIKLIATNDVHFVEEEHGEAHDRLICISTNAEFDSPRRMRYTKQEWLKSPQEMYDIFSDIPEALENTQEIVDKVETYDIDSDPIMPMFPIPESFGSEAEYRTRITEKELFDEFTQNEKHEVVLSQQKAEDKIKKLGGYDKLYRIKFEADYLEKLVWEGAHKRYGEHLTEEQVERIVFELHTIKTMGFPGYFLIVQDYIRGAREELDVSVGPGRGSAAGSVVAYCLWITDVDPLKYDLLFERFLNPDRISLPDIDVDFEDSGRPKVLEWITNKYGREKVAHIITYGVMASKSAIADVARIHHIPLNKVAELKSYVPERTFPDNIKDENGKVPKVNLHNCYKYIPELKNIMSGNDEELKQVLTYADELENTNRQVGIHACGVIIGADDLTKFAPICTIEDKKAKERVVVTQYDGHVVESVGLIKMDFLGLSNLTIIKDAIRLIKHTQGIDVDIDHIPIDDKKTFDLYCEGATVATFQFESVGMQRYLRELHPDVFEDLIAMNALYRPGPMDYIPDFIKRKKDPSQITYDIPCMETYLKDTYGITVYQEQVMLLSRQLAGFTRGQSDTLRKAMGKKQIEKMNELEVLFYEGGQKNGHDRKVLNKIWEDWKKFASYAFNKSHATCYAWVAYQTAYLKANFPAEYMAAVLTNSLSDISRVTELMEECHRMKLEVLLPSVNESDINFSVNAKGQIRFGLGAIKGMGEAAAQVIIDEREKNGPYTGIFDFLERVDLHSVNRKNIEVLALSGAFDQFEEMHRAQYFYKEVDSESSPTFLERLVRWASKKQEAASSSQMSIFDMCEEIKEEAHPQPPNCEPWPAVIRCSHEKEVIGFYISGHPLDDYKYEMHTYVHNTLQQLNSLENLIGRNITLGGVVTDSFIGTTKYGKPYGSITLSDYEGTYKLSLYDETFLKFKHFFEPGLYLYLTGAVVQRFYPPDKDGKRTPKPPSVNITGIMPLDAVMDKYTEVLTFHINLDDINESFCHGLEELAEKHRGNIPIQCMVHEPKSKLSLLMKSPTMRVSARGIIPELEQLPGVFDITPSSHA